VAVLALEVQWRVSTRLCPSLFGALEALIRKVLGLSARRVTLGELEQILRRCGQAPSGTSPSSLEQLVRNQLEMGAFVGHVEFWTHRLSSDLGGGLVNLRNVANHGNEVGSADGVDGQRASILLVDGMRREYES